MNCCGEVIAGETSKIVIRQKSDSQIEIGDILVEDRSDGKIFLQVYDLLFGSQISRLGLENISGMSLEGIGTNLEFLEPHMRNYIIVLAKTILHVTDKPHNPKILPNFMSTVRYLEEKDLDFLIIPRNPLFFGKIRTGSKILNSDVFLDGKEVLSHHILVSATTGKGKSNLIKVILWHVLDKEFCGILILDPHNEYYGKNIPESNEFDYEHSDDKFKENIGLKDHIHANKYLQYYSPNPSSGGLTLIINLKSIRPNHFRGIADFSEPQQEAMAIAFSKYGQDWISTILSSIEMDNVSPGTINVLKRKFERILGVYYDFDDNLIKCRSKSFSNILGESTIDDIVNSLEDGKKVIIDTSNFGDQTELLIGSIITDKLFFRYKRSKENGYLMSKPVVSIVIEEAPRVLSEEVLRLKGSNIYSDIAREGRKFKIGLIAVTQLTSIIPKTILANINTKIILGNELAAERYSLIQSASQDLSSDDRNIASLDKGEAIISSSFSKFAIPVKIPLFEASVAEDKNKKNDEDDDNSSSIGVIV